MSLIQLYCGAPIQMLPSLPTGGSELWGYLDTALLIRFKKHAENVTIYLQCLIRLNGKDVAVLDKQVFDYDEKI